MLISIKYQQNLEFVSIKIFYKPRMLFFLLMNVKMPTTVGIFNIYEQEKLHAQQKYA